MEELLMQTALRVQTTILPGHRIDISAPDLPEGAKVEVSVIILEQSLRSASDAEREMVRAAALDQFLVLARSSSFHSTQPYPTRDELHERP
jgi:hypothetical protein